MLRASISCIWACSRGWLQVVALTRLPTFFARRQPYPALQDLQRCCLHPAYRPAPSPLPL